MNDAIVSESDGGGRGHSGNFFHGSFASTCARWKDFGPNGRERKGAKVGQKRVPRKRHLAGIRRTPAYLVAPCTMTPPVPTPFPGSSPARVPTLTTSSSYFIREPTGLPEFSNASLLACHGLRTPVDIGALAMKRALHAAFQHVKTVGIRIGSIEAVPALQGRRFPLQLTATGACLKAHTMCTHKPDLTIAPAYKIFCVRLPHRLFAGYPTLQWNQHSIRVGR